MANYDPLDVLDDFGDLWDDITNPIDITLVRKVSETEIEEYTVENVLRRETSEDEIDSPQVLLSGTWTTFHIWFEMLERAAHRLDIRPSDLIVVDREGPDEKTYRIARLQRQSRHQRYRCWCEEQV